MLYLITVLFAGESQPDYLAEDGQPLLVHEQRVDEYVRQIVEADFDGDLFAGRDLFMGRYHDREWDVEEVQVARVGEPEVRYRRSTRVAD